MKMKPVVLLAAAACSLLIATGSRAAEVKQLMVKPIPEIPGKEALMLEVSYPPGAKDVAHRHDAHALLYVLEGTIEMQLKGGPLVRVKAGETFYEGPKDIHLIGRNASTTESARFVVVLIKGKGAPVLTPVDENK